MEPISPLFCSKTQKNSDSVYIKPAFKIVGMLTEAVGSFCLSNIWHNYLFHPLKFSA